MFLSNYGVDNFFSNRHCVRTVHTGATILVSKVARYLKEKSNETSRPELDMLWKYRAKCWGWGAKKTLPERTQCPTVFSQCVHIVTMLKRSNLTVWRWFYTVVSFFTECSHSDVLFHTVNWWFTVLKRSNLTLSQSVHTVFTVCSHCVSHCGTLCSFQQGELSWKTVFVSEETTLYKEDWINLRLNYIGLPDLIGNKLRHKILRMT